MTKNRAHLVKKTIVNKNGITTTVWVRATPKKKDTVKKKPVPKEVVETPMPRIVDRNYKLQPTEELIKEATKLGISWKVSTDDRINRMRVIMKLKEYYASNLTNTSTPLATKEPEFWKNEIEAAKYSNIEVTNEAKEVARQTGILAEDEQSVSYIKKTISEEMDSYFSQAEEYIQNNSRIKSMVKPLKFMLQSIKNLGKGGLSLASPGSLMMYPYNPVDIGCKTEDIAVYEELREELLTSPLPSQDKRDIKNFLFIKETIDSCIDFTSTRGEKEIINLFNSPELTKAYESTFSKDIPEYIRNIMMTEGNKVSPKALYDKLKTAHTDLKIVIKNLSKEKVTVLKGIKGSQRKSLLNIVKTIEQKLPSPKELESFMKSKYCTPEGEFIPEEIKEHEANRVAYKELFADKIRQVRKSYTQKNGDNLEDIVKYLATLGSCLGGLGFSSSKDTVNFIEAYVKSYFKNNRGRQFDKLIEETLEALPKGLASEIAKDIAKETLVSKGNYKTYHLDLMASLPNHPEYKKLNPISQRNVSDTIDLLRDYGWSYNINKHLFKSSTDSSDSWNIRGLSSILSPDEIKYFTEDMRQRKLKLKEDKEFFTDESMGYKNIVNSLERLSGYELNSVGAIINLIAEDYPSLKREYDNSIKNFSQDSLTLFKIVNEATQRLYNSWGVKKDILNVSSLIDDEINSLKEYTKKNYLQAIYDKLEDPSKAKKVVEKVMKATETKTEELEKLKKKLPKTQLDVNVNSNGRVTYKIVGDTTSEISKDYEKMLDFINECSEVSKSMRLSPDKTDFMITVAYNQRSTLKPEVIKALGKCQAEGFSKKNYDNLLNIAEWLKPEEKKFLKEYIDEYYQLHTIDTVTKGEETEVSGKDIKCSMRMATQAEYDKIAKEIEDSFDHKTHKMKYKIRGIYKINNLDVRGSLQEIIERRAERKANGISFEQGGSEKDPVQDTFYHGTSHTTLGKILGETGKFRIPKDDTEVVTGAMMGRGIYLADCSSKSMQYCGAGFRRTNSDGTKGGALIVCTASIGDCTDYRGSRTSAVTVYGDKKIHGLANNEWCVKDENAVAPEFIVDIEIL